MTEWIVSSSALILVMAALRYLLRGRLSPRLQYALWALVLLRLLAPVSLGESRVSVMNAVGAAESRSVLSAPPDTRTTGDSDVPEPAADGAAEKTKATVPGNSAEAKTPDAENTKAGTAAGQSPGGVLRIVWLAGVLTVGLCLFVSNIRFAVKLKKTRRPVEGPGCPLPVYVSDQVSTPCLFGLLRPAVYLTPEALHSGRALGHVLAHETTHWRHGDQVWSLLRCVCLALHWYNPLVWLAAALSMRDAELACDEGTLARIGEAERGDYGRTLLGFACGKPGAGALLRAATTMTGGKRGLRERVGLIAKKPKMAVYTLIFVLLIASAAVGCTFTGAKTEAGAENSAEADDASETDNAAETDGAAEAVGREAWSEADLARWQGEIDMDSITVPDPEDYDAAAESWAEAYVRQFIENTSEDSPVHSYDAAVLLCEKFAVSVLSEPREIIYHMRFACDAADPRGFENWFVGWAGPLDGADYPQYAGWYSFGWYVVLTQAEDGSWRFEEAGSGGFGGWGYLNYDEGAWALDDYMDEVTALVAGEDDKMLGEIVLRCLPLVDWGQFQERWDGAPGAEGWAALMSLLDEVCVGEGRVYGPEETRMWADVYPDDQAYRDMYAMLAYLNADGAYAEGLAAILKKQYDHDPVLFTACAGQLPDTQRDRVLSAPAYAG